MDMTGKTALITGANTGLGFEMARALAARGAHVIVAGRSAAKLDAAIARIRAETPEASLAPGVVDLNSLASVRDFAQAVAAMQPSLDVLINNAGVMVPPEGTTQDGFETQFGVNFVAHFALTGGLFKTLTAAPAARVVTMSSIGHRGAVLDFGNFRLEKPYDPWREYGQSKLADLIFALEFDRRLRRAGSPVTSVAAHPGVSQTDLTRNLGPVPAGIEMMSAADGAAPALVAATAPGIAGGQFWGPDGAEERTGKPGLALVDDAALDDAKAERLWHWAEETTGLRYP
ncbi:SDR family NAD(P)-dependent oxidoreductase [Rhodobacter sp. NTK016B]|uniref:oxidoreductase n=1 Tax=Rhodobacter sp. NTK016B TaxID=2759676 RepID=UPI001A8D0764|nr:oxidoreductase [Rhodobacter sp. NTK016B]MBN8290611.1 SDR family NAD(P)-dependent oxidoreductase [Rhodobacter sp. NTK016B]